MEGGGQGELLVIVMSVPLSVPIVVGLSPRTLILYPVPEVKFAGMVKLIVPDGSTPEAANVPITVGLANDPEASEISAVKIFPVVNVPTDVKLTVPIAVVLQSTVRIKLDREVTEMVFVDV